MDEVIVRTLVGPVTTTPGGGGGATGDPMIVNITGDQTPYHFHGESGSVYDLLISRSVEMTMRVAGVPTDKARTFIDSVEVKTSAHRVVVDLDGVRLDGKVMGMSDAPRLVDDDLVWHHVGDGGERRVDLTIGAWRLAVLHDLGLDEALHFGKELWQVPHLAVFVDGQPSDLDGVTGIFVNGYEGCDHGRYARTSNLTKDHN